MNKVPKSSVGTREEWLAAREELLRREKEHTRMGDELAQQRRELPWVPVDKEYRFETDEGTRTLPELFDGRSQLLVYHFMFGPDWTGGCPGCSFLVDHLDGIVVHLNQQDAVVACISHAPIEKLRAYKQRMGWSIAFISSFRNDLNFDFGVSFDKERGSAEYNFQKVDFDEVLKQFASRGIDLVEYVTTEGPGFRAFALSHGTVYHTYSAFAPNFGGWQLTFNQLLDRAPKGRDDSFVPRRHDEYEGS